MSNKVIQTILSLKDEMSAKLNIAAKATQNAKKQLEEAKKEIDKHRQASVKNTEALKQAKAEVNDLKKVHSMYRTEIARAEQQVKDLSNQTSKNKNEMKQNKLALDQAKQALDSLRQAQNQTKISIANAQAEVKKHESALQSSNKMIQEARNKAKQYGTAIAQTSGKIKEAKDIIKSWGKSTISAIDGAISKAKNYGMIVGTTLGVTAGTVGLNEAMNLEGYKTQLETATKDTEKASLLMRNAIKLANDTPFETGQVVESTAIMEAYGISSQRWLKDVADMAGATNKDILQATEAMADGSMGEFERLKEFGILKEDLIAAAAKKYGDNIVFNNRGQVLEREKLETILQETIQKKFAGGAEKQAKTLKGLWSTVTGVTKTSLANILGMTEDGTVRQGSMYEILKSKIQLVVDLLAKWQSDGTIQKIGEQVTQVVVVIINIVTGLYNLFMKYQDIILLIIKVVGTLYFLVKGIMLVISVVKILTTIISVLKAVWLVLNLVMGLSPLGIIVAGIVAIVAAGYALMKVLQGIWSLASKAFDAVKKALGFGKKKVKVETKTTEEEKIDTSLTTDFNVPKLEDIQKEVGLGMPKITVPTVGDMNSKGVIAQGMSQINNNTSNQEQKNITNNFYGDTYGFEDFAEKVAEAIMKITNTNKVNVIGE